MNMKTQVLLCSLLIAGVVAAQENLVPNPDFEDANIRVLKKRGSRLGGTTGQLALRFMGKESFILTGDVVNALIRENVIDNDRMSKKNLSAAQAAFNDWKTTSGRSLNEISRILAFSVGPAH